MEKFRLCDALLNIPFRDDYQIWVVLSEVITKMTPCYMIEKGEKAPSDTIFIGDGHQINSILLDLVDDNGYLDSDGFDQLMSKLGVTL